MKMKYLLIIALIAFLIVLDTDIALAGPGGAIVKGIWKTTIGKIIIIAVSIVFAPVIIYISAKEYFAVRKNKKILSELGRLNRDFSWLTLDKNVRNIFGRVYQAWDDGDIEKASSFITPWYWQNQQIIHLDRWEKQNLQNVCNVKQISTVKPLYLDISDAENLEGSKIAFSISAKISDYLVDKDTKKIMEGSKNYGDEEKIWIMEYTNGEWLLDNIDVGEASLSYAKMENIIPQTVLATVK